MLLYALDLIGTFAFATYGGHRALQRHLDVLGVFVCAGLTATGGGTVREAIMHGRPAYLRDYTCATWSSAASRRCCTATSRSCRRA